MAAPNRQRSAVRRISRLQHPSDHTIGWALTQAARLHRLHLSQKLADLGLFAGQEQVL